MKLPIYLWLPLYIFGVIMGVKIGERYTGERYTKAQIVKEALSKIPKIDITQAQKELTDFANKQRELYKKTHNGY